MAEAGYHLTDVGYRYPDRDEWALLRVELAILPGEFVGVVGPNGSGKSTLLKLLAGFLPPRTGAVRLADRPLASYSATALARQIAVVPQHVHFVFPFTVEEIVRMGRIPHHSSGSGFRARAGKAGGDREIIQLALEQLELGPLANRSILELSGGERQKVLVARALVQQPKILLLDEPTAFLDLHHQLAVYRLVQALNRDRGVTVVAVSHDLNLASIYSRRLLLLDRGMVRKDGLPGDVLTQAELDALYGRAVIVDRHPMTDAPRFTLQP